MSNKKGMEVAIGTIILIILAVLVFILAITIIFKIFGGAEEIKSQVDLKTKSQIEASMQRTNEIISIPFKIKSTKPGKDLTFGVGIKNIRETQQFSASLSFDNAYYPDGKEIEEINNNKAAVEINWLGNFKYILPFTLKKHEYKIIPITMIASQNIQGGIKKGDYVFNLCFFENTDEKIDCIPENIEYTYTGKIYQIIARII
jgi:hypothetical protein